MRLWSPCGAMGSIWDYGVCMGLWGCCVVPPLSLMGPTIRGCCSLWGAELQGPLQRRPGGTPFVSYRVSQSALFVVVGSPLCYGVSALFVVGPLLCYGVSALFVVGSPLCFGVSALLWGLRSVMGSPLCYGVSRAAVFTAHPSPAGLTALSGTWGNGGAAGGGTALPPPKPPPAVGPPSGGWVMAAILWGGLSAALPFAPHTQMGP